MLVDGILYYTTMSKDKKNCLQLKVIRDINERMTVIKKFHVDSNDLGRHNSKEWTAELVSQIYYWKGIYNDVCDYVSNWLLWHLNLTCLREERLIYFHTGIL